MPLKILMQMQSLWPQKAICCAKTRHMTQIFYVKIGPPDFFA